MRRLRHVVRMEDDAPTKRFFVSKYMGGKWKQERPRFQWEVQMHKTCLHLTCTTGVTSQRLETTGEVLYFRPRPRHGCSAEKEEKKYVSNVCVLLVPFTQFCLFNGFLDPFPLLVALIEELMLQKREAWSSKLVWSASMLRVGLKEASNCKKFYIFLDKRA